MKAQKIAYFKRQIPLKIIIHVNDTPCVREKEKHTHTHQKKKVERGVGGVYPLTLSVTAYKN